MEPFHLENFIIYVWYNDLVYDLLCIGKVFGFTEYQQTTQKAIKDKRESRKVEQEKLKVETNRLKAQELKEKLEEKLKLKAMERKLRTHEIILEYDPNEATIKELFSVQQVTLEHKVIGYRIYVD